MFPALLSAMVCGGFFVAALVAPTAGNALSPPMRYPYPPPEPSAPPPAGQVHDYSVLFRNNGEAIVTAQLAIVNSGKAPVDLVTLRATRLSFRSLKVWQDAVREECFSTYDGASAPAELCRPLRGGTAIPGYQYRVVRQQGWQEIPASAIFNQVVLPLVEPVPPGGQTRLLVRYRGFGYVKRGWFGRRSFDFVNLEASDEIRQVQVTVHADTDLYFQGGRSTLTFREEQFAAAPSAASRGAGTFAQGLSYSTIVGWGGGSYDRQPVPLVKSAQYLGPNELFHVRGVYGASWWSVYYPRVLGLMAAVVAAIAAFYAVHRRSLRRRSAAQPAAQPAAPSSPAAKPASATLGFFAEMGWGLAGAVLIWLVNGLIVFSFSRLGVSSQGGSEAFLMLPLFTLVWVVPLVSLFVAPIYVGWRYGKKPGLVVFGWQLLFLVVSAVTLALWWSSVASRSSYTAYPRWFD